MDFDCVHAYVRVHKVMENLEKLLKKMKSQKFPEKS